MLQSSTKKTLTKFDIIATYQIIGGLLGVVFQILLLLNSDISRALLFFTFLAICLYSFSIYCGILFFINHESWIRFSLLNQFLQIFNFSLLGFGFEYVSGISQCVGIDFTTSFNLRFNFTISSWHILINGDTEINELNINLIAFYIIILIEQYKKKKKRADVNNRLSEIGK